MEKGENKPHTSRERERERKKGRCFITEEKGINEKTYGKRGEERKE